MTKVVWSAENIAALQRDSLERLRANALRLGEHAVVDLCETELASRAPKKVREKKIGVESVDDKKGKHVVGFHFVCDTERGVSHNPDGSFWTGTWVVDQQFAERGVKIGAYVALHRTKVEPSYRQGIVKAWRRMDRERQYGEAPAKRETGLDFLVQPTDQPLDWVGTGTGEKGYNWADI